MVYNVLQVQCIDIGESLDSDMHPLRGKNSDKRIPEACIRVPNNCVNEADSAFDYLSETMIRAKSERFIC